MSIYKKAPGRYHAVSPTLTKRKKAKRKAAKKSRKINKG